MLTIIYKLEMHLYMGFHMVSGTNHAMGNTSYLKKCGVYFLYRTGILTPWRDTEGKMKAKLTQIKTHHVPFNKRNEILEIFRKEHDLNPQSPF